MGGRRRRREKAQGRESRSEPRPRSEAVRRKAPSGDPLREIAAGVIARRRADEGIARAVGNARDAGVSWAEIGRVLGVSKQAAHERYGPHGHRNAAEPETAQISLSR
jgi:hypothetical protein